MQSIPIEHKAFLQKAMIEWYRRNHRTYDWRGQVDPYRVLVSEIMLQQTNADRVEPVYTQFIHKYPNVGELSHSELEALRAVLKPLGLGYRVARLKKMAQTLIAEHGGKVPSVKEALLALPGVGQYIANAVLCFAYSNRVPLVDINVVRLYERVFSLRSDKKRAREDPKIWEFAAEMMPVTDFKEYNWALIDYGATICLGKYPRCDKCTIRGICNYFNDQCRSKSKKTHDRN